MTSKLGKNKIKPLAGYALIEPQEAEEVTASGIVLPDTAKEPPAQGRVVAVNTPVIVAGHEVKAEFKPGDTILYKSYSGEDIKIEGKGYKLLKFYEDVIAVVQ